MLKNTISAKNAALGDYEAVVHCASYSSGARPCTEHARLKSRVQRTSSKRQESGADEIILSQLSSEGRKPN